MSSEGFWSYTVLGLLFRVFVSFEALTRCVVSQKCMFSSCVYDLLECFQR